MAQKGQRQSYPPEEDALPKGHPCRADYDPDSDDAKIWRGKQKALTQNDGLPPGYTFDASKPNGSMHWVDGVDPLRPDLEPYTGHVMPIKPVAVAKPAPAAAKPEAPVLRVNPLVQLPPAAKPVTPAPVAETPEPAPTGETPAPEAT